MSCSYVVTCFLRSAFVYVLLYQHIVCAVLLYRSSSLSTHSQLYRICFFEPCHLSNTYFFDLRNLKVPNLLLQFSMFSIHVFVTSFYNANPFSVVKKPITTNVVRDLISVCSLTTRYTMATRAVLHVPRVCNEQKIYQDFHLGLLSNPKHEAVWQFFESC